MFGLAWYYGMLKALLKVKLLYSLNWKIFRAKFKQTCCNRNLYGIAMEHFLRHGGVQIDSYFKRICGSWKTFYYSEEHMFH